MDPQVLDTIISRLVATEGNRPTEENPLSEAEIRLLCLVSKDIFLEQPNLLELKAPVKICGGIHGQYSDLLRLFEFGGFPPESNYLFLGNYFDYGRRNMETMCLLLAYKIKYPDNFFLLLANHECPSLYLKLFSWKRFSWKLWEAFTDCFNCLPVAALVNEKIFCVHGGLSPELENFDQIRNLPRPAFILDEGLLCDLLWSVPREDIPGYSRLFIHIFTQFLKKHDLEIIYRAHQVQNQHAISFPKVVKDGHELVAHGQLVTIFSAPSYRDQFDSAGAIMSIDENLMYSFQILKRSIKRSNFFRTKPMYKYTFGVKNGLRRPMYGASSSQPLRHLRNEQEDFTTALDLDTLSIQSSATMDSSLQSVEDDDVTSDWGTWSPTVFEEVDEIPSRRYL